MPTKITIGMRNFTGECSQFSFVRSVAIVPDNAPNLHNWLLRMNSLYPGTTGEPISVEDMDEDALANYKSNGGDTRNAVPAPPATTAEAVLAMDIDQISELIEAKQLGLEDEYETIEELQEAVIAALGLSQPDEEEDEEPVDFSVVRGLGGASSASLHAAGITTFAKFISTPDDQLASLLRGVTADRAREFKGIMAEMEETGE